MKMFKWRLPIKYLLLTCFTLLCFIMLLGNTTQIVYASSGEAISDEIFLDTVAPDNIAPEVIMGYEFVTVIANQKDLGDYNNIKSGIALIEYGYKLSGTSEYTWSKEEDIYDLTVGASYDFVTKTTDKAGNATVSKVTTTIVENSSEPILLIENVHNISTSNQSYMKSSDRLSIIILAKTAAYSSTSLTASDIIIKVGDIEVTPDIKKLSSPIEMPDGVKWTLTLSGVSGNGNLTVTIPENKILDSMNNGNVETVLDTETIVDNIIPSECTVTINNGDEIASNKNVLLSIEANNADYIFINNTGVTPNESDNGWIEYVTNKYHELVGNTGINTVYVWFKDSSGNIVGPVTDTIEIGTVLEETIQTSIFLDDVAPDNTAPNIKANNGIVKIISMQKDVYKDNVISGISKVLYGYKVHTDTKYIWLTTDETTDINTTNEYDFITKVVDAAGNETTSEVTTMTIEENTIPLVELGNIYNISTNNPSYIKSSDRVSLTFFANSNDYYDNTLKVDDIIVRAGTEIINPTIKNLATPIKTDKGVKWSLTLEGITGNGELNLIIPENKVINSKYEGNIETILNTGSMVDNELPSDCTVTINNGDAETNDKNVLLVINAVDADYIYANNTGIAPNENADGWVEYVTTKYHELIGNTGTNTAYVWFKDLAGNIVGPISDNIEITGTESTIQATIFLDDQAPDDVAPNVSSSNGMVKVISMQKDIYKDGVKSGVASVLYGYKVHSDSDYTWVTSNEIKDINITNEYDFITKATDAAGNTTTSQVTTILVEEDTTPKVELTKIYNLSTYNASYIKSTDRIQIVFKAKTTDYKENSLTIDDIIFKVGNESINPTTKTLTEPVETADGLVWKLTISGITGNGLLTLSIPENKVFNTKYEGNVETILNTGSVVDNTAPTNCSVVINNGDASTEAISVTLTLNATGADYMYISNETAAPAENNAGWSEFVSSKAHTLIGELGTNSVYVWYKDLAGNIVGYATDTIEVATLDQAVQATIFLDTQAPDTTAPAVNPVGQSVKIVSNQKDVNKDGVKSGITKIEYGYKLSGTSDAYTFQSSDIIDDIIGNQTYDFVTRATDFAGNTAQSEATTMLIEEDTTPVFKFDYKKNITTSNALYIKQADIVEIGISVDSSKYDRNTLTVEELVITVGGVEVEGIEKDLSLLESTSTGEKWKLILGNVTGNGELLIEIPENEAFDTAGNGNVSAIIEPLMTVDNIAPTDNSISLANGADETINQDTLITIKSTGAKYMYISNATTAPTEFSDVWVEYTNQKYHRLTDGEGDKIVYAWFKDEAGNISGMVSDGIALVENTGAIQDEIFLDTLPPTTDAPTLLFSTYVTICCHQTDLFADGGYKSGIVKIEYGYRRNGSTDAYTYQTGNILYNVPAVDYYEFVTRATDAAGNVSVSEPTVEYVDITDIYVDVIFDAGIGTVSPRVKTYKYGENYTELPKPTPPIAHRFLGWYTGTDATGNLITDGMEITNQRNHTLYAAYEECRDVSQAEITLKPSTYIYDGTAKTPDTTVDFAGYIATRDSDYTVEYRNNVDVGTAYAIISGKGDYYIGRVEVPFEIEPDPDMEFEVTLDNYTFVWDGTDKKPIPTVKTTVNGEEVTLEDKKDYIVTYNNNIEPSVSGEVIITGINNFGASSATENFTINKATRNANVIMPDYYYNKTISIPDLTNKDELSDVTYYYNTENSNSGGVEWSTVTDSKYLDANTYYIYAVIKETEHYYGETTPATEFAVLKSYAVHPTVEDKVYNGHVQVGIFGSEGIILTGITEAKDAKTYIVYGELDSKNYEWAPGDAKKDYTWTIVPFDISKTDITLVPNTDTYDGNICEPNVEILFNNEFTLQKDIDFKVSYENNVNSGEGKVIITGINNFNKECIKTFTIEKGTLGKIEIEQSEYMYTGGMIKPIEKVYDTAGNLLTKDKDYTLYYQNNVEVGTAIVGAIGKDNYKGNVETTFEILTLPIDYAQITLKGAPYIFDGNNKCPEAEVILNGKLLVKGRDYDIEYENNINAGENTAIAIIRGKGQYKGSAQKNFTIMKANRIPSVVSEKHILLGTTNILDFVYDGDISTTTVTVGDSTILKVEDTSILEDCFLDITGLRVGKTTITIVVEESSNYNELMMIVEVTVFENQNNTKPIGTVIINDDAKYAISPRVMLTLDADFAEYMYISESNITPSADASDWYEFSYKMPYVFENTEGVKTIYVWFKDERGNVSKMATDSIILDYGSGVPAPDNVLLDQTGIDTTPPETEKYKQYNDGIDFKVIFKQKDIMVNGVRSGVDHTTIKYGYKLLDDSSNDYTWQDSPIIEKLKYNTGYSIVTQAYDRAGNGPVISEQSILQTERKYELVLTLEDTNVQYSGRNQEIAPVTYEAVDGFEITGKLVYTYYLDEACTILTTVERDGSIIEGGAPSKPGIYYVKAVLTEDINYYDTESNVAELRIGWDISNTQNDDVFAYIERTALNKDEYILKIIGNGDMASLDKLLINNSDESVIYWSEYKTKIIDIEFINTMDETINSIGASIFNNLTEITDIDIPDTIIKIGEYAFEGCTNVTNKVFIPISVEEIGGGAFRNVNTIAFEVAYGHTKYDVVDDVLMDIEHKELIAYPNGKTDERYEIPSTIITIREAAFSGSDNLKNVVIPNGVETIETKAFYECPRLEIIEIEDLMETQDNIMNLKTIGNMAFENIGTGSIIYTFSENVANKFIAGKTHIAADTEIYWPPVITLQPINMNGAVGEKVKFIIDTKDGYPAETKYQWFRVEGGVETAIPDANGKEYITPSLTVSDHNVYYYCRVYNLQYYYDRGYLNSNKAQLTMLDSANYIIERGTYNTYLFEKLTDAFDFAINADVIKVLKTVNNEAEATLTGNKSIIFDLNSNTINLVGKIGIDSGSKIDLIGSGTINKSGDYTIENAGELILNGEFKISNNTGYGINSLAGSKLVFTSGSILAGNNAIYAENSEITINGENANIIVTTDAQRASAIELHKENKFNMTNGSISITHTGTMTDGNINGIYLNGTALATTNISGGIITATSTSSVADAIVNAGISDIMIAENANITGSRSGVTTSSSNTYGDIIVRGGKITGGEFGILNNATEAKVIIGKEGEGVSTVAPIIVGEKVAIFNTKEKNTVEIYDGILYSHSQNVIYEELNNTDLNISSTNSDAIYRENGRAYIKTERNYSLAIEENVSYNSSTYKAVYLKANKEPTLTGLVDQTVEVGEKATFEIIASGGQPDYYEYEWEVSTDGGLSWSKIVVGTGINSSKYTTPISTITMDGYMYRCIVSNEKYSIISKAVTLYVVTNNELGGQRPIVRVIFTDGRVINYENISNNDTRKYVNMQIIVKTFDELETLKLNGETIYERIAENVNGTEFSRVVEYEYSDKSLIEIMNKIGDNPIKIEKMINGETKIVEYTYTYNIKVYENDIITVIAEDIKDRTTTTTQTVDLFYDLKVDHYVSALTQTNNNRIITFYANKPVKPISSIVNSYINSTYLDLVSLDNSEYSYRYTLELDDALPATEFWFEDVYGNQVVEPVEAILRVKYKNVKFNDNTVEMDDLNVIDAYQLAQDIEENTEINAHEEIQSRYGLNSVQSDVCMSRARDLGTIDILNNSSKAKSYDGLFTEEIESTITDNLSAHGYVESTSNVFVSAVAKSTSENELSKENRRYVDVIAKDLSLYKAMNIDGFRIDDSAPYMYSTPTGATNITASTIAKAAFRATIIAK